MRFKLLLFTIFSLLFTTQNTWAQLSRVQFINNSGDQMLNAVDIYIDGQLIMDDLFFRHATAFNGVNNTSPVRIALAPQTSIMEADSFYSTTLTLTPGGVYVMIITGNESVSGYTPNVPGHLDIYNMGREAASVFSNTDILLYHGSTDAATVDFKTGLKTLADNLSYGSFSTYQELAATDYIFRTTNTNGTSIISSYDAPFASNHGMTGQAGVVLYSGYANPANNSNGPDLGLWLASTGGGPMVELLPTNHEKLARIQLIHNTADDTASMVDIYVDGLKSFDNVPYKSASPFVDAYAEQPTTISVAPSTSSSVADTFFSMTTTLDSTKTYVAVLNGIRSTSGYKPAPAMTIHFNNAAREFGTSGTSTDILFMNGITDVSNNVDIKEGTSNMFSNIAYGSFGNYVQITTTNTTLELNKAGGSTIGKYTANFLSLSMQGQAVTLLSTGFNEPDSNSSGPFAGLYVAKREGGPLVELPIVTSVKNIRNNMKQLHVVPNPASTTVKLGNIQNLSNIQVYNSVGQLVLNIEETDDRNEINISSLPSGSYFLFASSKKKSYYGQFIKQ